MDWFILATILERIVSWLDTRYWSLSVVVHRRIGHFSAGLWDQLNLRFLHITRRPSSPSVTPRLDFFVCRSEIVIQATGFVSASLSRW